MAIVVHHKPAAVADAWNMHVWQAAWDGNSEWDQPGTANAGIIDFQFPGVPDPRRVQFQFEATAPTTVWEPSDFIRRLFLVAPAEVWTFDSSTRVLYQNPFPPGVVFNPGDVLTFQVITQSAFASGQLYVWTPYDATVQPVYFPQTARDSVNGVSTFQVILEPWMTLGFHLKLMQPASGSNPPVWEPNASNRVWRPCDGASLWLKSGQSDVRSQPLALTAFSLEVLHSAALPSAPQLTLTDTVEQSTFPVTAANSQPYAASPLFNVSTYNVSIYPGASYAISGNFENPPLQRPFPADPTVIGSVSRFALGATAWLSAFPPISNMPLAITPRPASSFTTGVSVQISIGNGPAYATVPAAQLPDGSWNAALTVALNTTTSIVLIPAAGSEPKPYDWIDTSRYFTPAAGQSLYTTEEVYGVTSRGPTRFADPPDRSALMQSAFGPAVVACGVFAAREIPHGATIMDGSVYFVVHAPHAIQANLILVDATASRTQIPMTLTSDTFYWWCSLPLAQAPAGTRYRFLLNDNTEVIDPAARAVDDGGSLTTSFGDDPSDPTTSWSIVLDAAAVSAASHAQPWQTMGWQNFLIYEIHSRRFTNLAPPMSTAFDFLIDEMNATSRLGKPGYLRQLPATVFGLMPANEFSSALSWGYDPSYYFAIDSFYGGAEALARFVNAAHASGRGVTLDVVYNHSLGSSLMKIAADVYRAGDYDGDLMNCGHPMVGEYFRQASVYLLRTFNLDGFRFDDTNTIVTRCTGGWQFLGMIRNALRMAASAEGRTWPYCVAENSGTSPWDVSNPGYGVMDGQWGIDEVYSIRDASYDSWTPGSDHSGSLRQQMDDPQYWGRPFFQAVRFGESHDMVSAQDPGNQRIAARPPFGQGYQLAKALGALTLLSNGVPMLFMGQEIGETQSFSFDNSNQWINPQLVDLPVATATDQTRILALFRQLMGLRNDGSKGLQGDANYQVVATGNRTLAFTCGANQCLFAVVTFGTPNQQQNSGWLGLPSGSSWKEIFNSSWPAFQVGFEPEYSNGGYDAQIESGQILNLPYMGAVVLERR
jgi:1,4-alpha-glucan branching enzyme